MLLKGVGFLASTDNYIELLSIVTTFMGIFSKTLDDKVQYTSIAILSLIVSFTFLIQKLRVFGSYVLAFRRTLINSAKFMPVFLIIYVGFLLSFRVRISADVKIFNSTGSTSFLSGKISPMWHNIFFIEIDLLGSLKISMKIRILIEKWLNFRF
jgi:hypothetical protein